MKTILVTGGAGFIGSNFIIHLLEQTEDYRVINLDKLTYAGNPENLKPVENDPRYSFVQGDICNAEFVDRLFAENDLHGVVHFAAESHVDNSITGPKAFIDTNITGTFVLLEAARKNWMEAPRVVKPGLENRRFLHVSTDEVYGSLGSEGLFKETTPYAPNSPYSASKASSDMLVRSYFHTYGLNVVTTNCSNNYGPRQHDEKLIPTIIRKAISGEKIPIYGDGLNVRDWLYVTDHCRGVLLAFEKGRSGETYNIGGENERTNIYIAKKICGLLNSRFGRSEEAGFENQLAFVTDRPGHDKRYAIDATKIKKELGWKAQENFETGIEKTINWYLNKWNK